MSDSFRDKEKAKENFWENTKNISISVVVAIAMWYIVSVQDRIEAQVEINVDYMQIPPNLIVTKGLISKLTVRLKGPEKLIRAIPRDNFVHTVNLSSIKKGVNKVPISTEVLGPSFRAYDIVDIDPPSIEVSADNLVERSVPIKQVLDSPLLGKALTVTGVNVHPGTVIVRGPETVISEMRDLPLVISLDPREEGTSEPKTLVLDTPSLVSATPPSVRVSYTVTSSRDTVSRFFPVEIDNGNSGEYEISPKDLYLVVEVPFALVNNQEYLDELKITVVPHDMEPNQTVKLKPNIKLGAGMVILNRKAIPEISVTKIGEPLPYNGAQ